MQTQPVLRLSRRSIVGFVLTTLATAALLVVLFVRLLSASQVVTNSAAGSPIVGRAAPNFSISIWNGVPKQTVALASLRGKPVVVNFFASWCEPCHEESPVLAAAYRRYGPQGVVIPGIAYQDTQQDALTFLRQQGLTYPAGPDASGVISVAYGVTGIPETVFINREGTVTFKFGGAIDDGTMARHIQAILSPASANT